ncbi:hypothetical protein ALC56_05553 [Trachymyrmex septentrionalis]|uniref:Uncharacterized protein n=1 Tax=Trachymyrmex septentrionalis TaxID=34720 RepID=A0A151JXQ5_9HYME|nr:hypothetical protein ALC56_05553 [Trachymyrmex septentrionalis]
MRRVHTADVRVSRQSEMTTVLIMELNTVYLKSNVYMLDYISCVKELRSVILGTEHRSRGVVSPAIFCRNRRADDQFI